jgi:hypothetical protein
MSRLANGRVTTRLTPGATGAGSAGRPGAAPRKGLKSSKSRAGRSALFGHQDAQSIAIIIVVAILALALVAGVWLAIHRMTRPDAVVMARPPAVGTVAGPGAETNTYWEESFGVFRHYRIDNKTGRIIDVGRVSIDEMIKDGIDVPGYKRNVSPSARGGNQDELALRFRALRDHLNNDEQ